MFAVSLPVLLMLSALTYGPGGEPVAARIPFEVPSMGEGRVDYYYWLRDISDPAVLEYLTAENSYAEEYLSHTDGLADSLYEEMAARLPLEDSSVPWELDGWWYGTRYPQGMEYPVYFRREGSVGGEEHILFDMNEMAAGREYLAIEGMSVSPDGGTIALALDTLGDHCNTMIFLDAATGGFMNDSILGASGDIAWAADSRTVFCGLLDPTGRTDRIVRYSLGSGSEPEEVFFEADSTFWPWVYESRSRDWILIGTVSTETAEFLLIPSADPSCEPVPVRVRSQGILYTPEFAGDSLYILTNDGAENFRLMRTSPLAREEWTEVLPGSPDLLIEGIDGFRDQLVLLARSEGRPGVLIRDLPGGDWREAGLPDEPRTVYAVDNHEYDTGSLRLEYSSLTSPWSTLSCNMATGAVSFLKTDSVIGFDPGLYSAVSLQVPAPDGRLVPVSLVYRKDLFVPGSNPLLLYAYGAYGYSTDPYFSAGRLSLLDRGFVYAIAHVRGGQELGRAWYEEGRLLRKRNTFTDFIACGEYLADEGWCDPGQLFAQGESAGGLLAGAVVTMRPDLWRGVVAGVPFVDVVTTMLDETIPLTTNEYSEWGDPSDPAFYGYMLSYSPYDNVAPVDYPAMLVTAGIHDSQVGYWEPAKWVAKMRFLGTGEEPLLFLTDMEAGHGGASGRYSWLRQIAVEYAFLLDCASRPRSD
jgi:oligopeptidase B